MFRSRTSSAKPGDELLANFRQQFPEVAVSTSAAVAPVLSQTVGAEHPGIAAPPPVPERSQSLAHDVFRDQDPTPRATNEPWRFTPSLLDPNSISFANFANAPPGYYTPTPGGTNTIFHSQAGDLHTPTLGLVLGLNTPLSMPTSGDILHHSTTAGPMNEMPGFHAMPPHQFTNFNPFIQAPPPQPTFAPSTFVHRDTGYETMDQDGSPLGSDPSEERMNTIDVALQNQVPMAGLQSRQFPVSQIANALPASAEKFRFHGTLNAPTAMTKHADEIPVTYLNKGQAYSLCVTDTNATMPVAPGTKYRTFVRISFEDEEQRSRPGICWGLWKEGRGTNEAHQRGGKLQAVEFVEAGQPVEGDDTRTRVELETSSFDGFSVIWTPGINGSPEVNIAVRFNFLSTDFSHSKGVKGIPVRLCAKTNPLPSDPSLPAADANPEVCYCKVKLFRDHGAERKLSNDVAHIKKSIDKLKQQIAQAESGIKDFSKRKRSSVAMKAADGQRPGKVQKHKRTWSMSSASSAGGGRMSMEDDLHVKLQTLQDMFTSTRPISILYLRGEEGDDPDRFPVALPRNSSPQNNSDGREGINWQARSGHSSVAGSTLSASPSSISLASQTSAVGTNPWQNFDSVADISRKGSDQAVKIVKSDDDGNLSGWIETLGVDPTYRPPIDRLPKPVACFYIMLRNPQAPSAKEYHKAVYLSQRSLREFVERVAAKWGINPSLITQTIHVTHNGLEVEMDDDVIRELKEGQDMVLQVEQQAAPQGPVKREWEMVVDSGDGVASSSSESPSHGGVVLRFTF